MVSSPLLIDREQDFIEASEALAQLSGPVAIDTERAQGYRYGFSPQLVQIRKSTGPTYLFDLQALPSLTPLAESVKDTWLLHAADQDLFHLSRSGLETDLVFDTEIAARLIGLTSYSLSSITQELLGIELEKNHQKEDWSTRPLPRSWQNYAASDVANLHELRQVLETKLNELGRTEWANQEFSHLLANPLQPKEKSWQDLKGFNRLKNREQMAVARSLWNLREELGQQLDLAPGRILTNRAIIDASIALPKSKSAIQQIPDFRRPQARKHRDKWWKAISGAIPLDAEDMEQIEQRRRSDQGPPAASMWKRLDTDAWERLSEIRLLVEKAAETVELEPEVVLEPKVQRLATWEPPQTPLDTRLKDAGARPWQRELLASVTR